MTQEETVFGSTDPFKFKLGAQVRETVTGYEGTITSRYEYLNGCRRYGIESMKDGEHKELCFDEQRLEELPTVAPQVQYAGTGGSRPTPPRSGAR